MGVDEAGHEQAAGKVDASRCGSRFGTGIRVGGVGGSEERFGVGGHLGEGAGSENPAAGDEHRVP